jgi:hypothetical protein
VRAGDSSSAAEQTRRSPTQPGRSSADGTCSIRLPTASRRAAEKNTLFEIDAELEAKFDAATNEEEQTGVISEEAKQRCLDLFAELGKKVDRIARYLRATEFKARAAKEEAARLTARQKTAENRLAQVKSMLAFYMLSPDR